MALVTHRGGCHCGAIRFEVQAPADLDVWKCNCSICDMKKNHHFVVPERRFKLLAGSDKLSTYEFNTRTAKHHFCSVCGICSFYRPRSNPDGYAVTLACLDPGTLASTTVTSCDGREWERWEATNRNTIKAKSVVND